KGRSARSDGLKYAAEAPPSMVSACNPPTPSVPPVNSKSGDAIASLEARTHPSKARHGRPTRIRRLVRGMGGQRGRERADRGTERRVVARGLGRAQARELDEVERRVVVARRRRGLGEELR